MKVEELKEICRSNGWNPNQTKPNLIDEIMSRGEKSEHGWTDLNFSSEKITEPDFSGNCTKNLKASTPYEIFTLFFDRTIITHITAETNRYMDQMGKNVEFKQHFQSECTYEIIMGFIGVLLWMGICKLPSFSDYWCENGEGYDPVRSIMSRNQFTSIFSTIHLSNNNQKDPNDIFYKIRPLIKHLESKFKYYWSPTTIISIDEDMIGSRHNHPSIQYMPAKPTKWGFKVFKKADSKGYLYSFMIYQGKAGKDTSRTSSERGLVQDVILYLLKDLPKDQKYHVYMDNYYSSIDIFSDLYEKKQYYATGTIKNTAAGLPYSLRHSSENSEVDYVSKCLDKKMMLWRINDSKSFNLLSTFSTNGEHFKDVKYVNSGTITKEYPQELSLYRSNMGHVDRNNKNIGQYQYSLKSRRWWLNIFKYFLYASIVNAWIIYNEWHQISLLEFIRDISRHISRHYSLRIIPITSTTSSSSTSKKELFPNNHTKRHAIVFQNAN
ncbi:transposase [Heterostelium album PN500]|uniref:Transposase n=1 Tax=Heterostelium pallidum (strain ATCC 26659 / Pp 5 / PN500) TaxID=670386 RepID=D3B903_HETP5|nr:transposase [Heterostelium album PN500]EFA82042.1 transposase [Heterostelium album PN500]|eukprot:XP_020434159.1 transposase [Heterostelium album PN500]